MTTTDVLVIGSGAAGLAAALEAAQGGASVHLVTGGALPVGPAAHYLLGGVRTDAVGQFQRT